MNKLALSEPIEFEWDKHNSTKVRLRHNITPKEAEQPFFDANRLIFFDEKHSNVEKRYQLLGRNDKDRMLLIVFTVRSNKLRVISARDANEKERIRYGKKT